MNRREINAAVTAQFAEVDRIHAGNMLSEAGREIVIAAGERNQEGCDKDVLRAIAILTAYLMKSV